MPEILGEVVSFLPPSAAERGASRVSRSFRRAMDVQCWGRLEWTGHHGALPRRGWMKGVGPRIIPWAPPPIVALRVCECSEPGCTCGRKAREGDWPVMFSRELLGRMSLPDAKARPPAVVAALIEADVLSLVISFLSQREETRLRCCSRFLRYRPALGQKRSPEAAGALDVSRPAPRECGCVVVPTGYLVDYMGSGSARRYFQTRVCGRTGKWLHLQYFAEDNPRYGRFRVMLQCADTEQQLPEWQFTTLPLNDFDSSGRTTLCYAGFGRCEWDIEPYVNPENLSRLASFLCVPPGGEEALWNLLVRRCMLFEEVAAQMPAVSRRFKTDLRTRAAATVEKLMAEAAGTRVAEEGG